MVDYSQNVYLTAHGDLLLLPHLNEAQWRVVASAYKRLLNGENRDDFLDWCSSLPVLRSIGIPVTEDGACEYSDLDASPLHRFLYDIHYRLSIQQGYDGCLACCLSPVKREKAERSDFKRNAKVIEDLLRA